MILVFLQNIFTLNQNIHQRIPGNKKLYTYNYVSIYVYYSVTFRKRRQRQIIENVLTTIVYNSYT
jgi:hypothetical protein